MQELVEQVEEEPTQTYGVLTWDWMSLLYSRALSTYQPVVRKLGLYRLLRVDVGGKEASQKKQKGKKQTRNIQVKASNIFLLETMNPDFILNILLPSWNSLVTSVGYNMNLDKNGKVETEDMVPLFTTFLQSHLERMDSNDAEVFWKKLSSWSLVEKLHIKTIMLVFRSLSQKLFPTKMNIPADEETLLSFVTTYGNLFQIGSVVLSFRRELLQILAMMLSLCILPAGSTKKWSPMTVLKLLSLYSDHYLSLESENWNIDGEKMLVGLQDWISHQGHDSKVVGATMATAFVGGELNPTDGVWDATVGVTNIERKLAWSISLLCAFAANGHQQSTAGELLWPAIHKGLSNTAGAILSNTHGNADQVGRALILLENGCKLRLLSGLGNGDLVVDRNTQQLMPPPPNIEKMLSSSVDFILFHIQKLVSIETRGEAIGGTRQNWAKRTSTTFARLIAQIRTLHQSYPSSEAVSSAMDELLKSSVKDLSEGAENDSKRVALVALIYAAVSAGANPGADSHISFCQLLLKTELTGDLRKVSKAWEQTARSVLQYAKWAVISCIFPLLLSTLEGAPDSKRKEAQRLAADILVEAFDAVEATPADALLPLFHCIIATGKQWVSFGKEDNKMGEQVYLKNLTMIIKALLAVLKDSTKSRQSSLMLNEICALIFQPKLLYEEYKRLEDDPDCYTPIRDAFRKLIGTAGTQRPHITRSVLCRIAVGWLGDDESNTGMLGLNAIPYRDDIVQLLVHKESKVEESASNQNKGAISGGAQIPPETDELSMTRAFVLVFLSKLPDPSNGLNAKVLKELLHYVILQLFDKTAPKTSSNSPKLVMKGTASYCVKMRAWQALCNLSRFVTSDLADQVCDSAFNSMPESIHNQIRFFIENFSIKCATMHPEVFGPRFIKDISQRDLSLQHIASLVSLYDRELGHFLRSPSFS